MHKRKAKKPVNVQKEGAKSIQANVLTPFQKNRDLFCIGALMVVSLAVFWSLTIESKTYTQADNLTSAVYYHQVDQYYLETGEIARWNPYIFGGVPNIFELPKSALNLDYYLDLLASGSSLPFIFFWFGASGLFVLLRFLEFERLISFFGSLVFILSPFNISLVINGHDSKIQAIMYAPWIFWALLRLLRNRSWLDVCLLTVFAGLQIRTSHYQIVFYTAILSILFVLSDLIGVVKASRKVPWRQLLLLSVATAGALLIATRPLLLAATYAGDSVRGREVVRMNDQNTIADPEKGVSKAFVKNWSFKPVELLSMVVARAQGGNSNEYYGKARSIGFRQDIIPGYWGHSPYNGSYYYMGTFIFMLVMLAFFWIRKNPFLWSLGIGLLLMLIWSLGTYAGPIYDLSYSLIPFFSNFRTPTTSMSLVYLLAPIVAAYGLRSIGYFKLTEKRKLLNVLGIVAGVAILLFMVGNSVSYINPKQKYQPNVADMLIEARRAMYFDDLFWYVISAIIFATIIWFAVWKKISLQITVIAFLMLSVVDLMVVSSRYSDKAVSQKEFNRTYLDDSQTTLFLKNDASNFRVLALGNQNFGLPAHLQTIGGGYDMQMNKSMYELTNNCLYQKLDGNAQINWNVLDFMNVKYVISDRVLQSDRLNQELADPAKGIYTYRYKFNKDRAFFVDEYQIVRDDVARMEMINSPSFDARRTAILEEYAGDNLLPNSRSKVDLVSFEPNKIVYTVEIGNPGLFVMSDMYQPKLQKLYLDGDPVKKVYKTNHAIQSIMVPTGLHTIELRYDEKIFDLSALVSNISFMLLYLVLGYMIYSAFRSGRKPPKALVSI